MRSTFEHSHKNDQGCAPQSDDLILHSSQRFYSCSVRNHCQPAFTQSSRGKSSPLTMVGCTVLPGQSVKESPAASITVAVFVILIPLAAMVAPDIEQVIPANTVVLNKK